MVNYKEHIKSPEWKALRRKVLERCEGYCEKCTVRRVKHVHHLTYETLGNEDLEDLQGLCLACHQAKHPDKIIVKEWGSIRDICARFNIPLSKLREILIKNRLVTKEMKRKGFKNKRVVEYLPTLNAWAKGFVDKDYDVKCKTILWNAEKLDKIIPLIDRNKSEYISPYPKAKSKLETYTEFFEPYCVTVKYRKKHHDWELKNLKNRYAYFCSYGSLEFCVYIGKNGKGEYHLKDIHSVVNYFLEKGFMYTIS